METPNATLQRASRAHTDLEGDLYGPLPHRSTSDLDVARQFATKGGPVEAKEKKRGAESRLASAGELWVLPHGAGLEPESETGGDSPR